MAQSRIKGNCIHRGQLIKAAKKPPKETTDPPIITSKATRNLTFVEGVEKYILLGERPALARLAKCLRCGKTGHFRKVCRSAIPVHGLELETTESEKEWQFLGTITGVETKPWLTELLVNQRKIKLKIDTGADVTGIPAELYDQQKDGPLVDTDTSLVGPGRAKLNSLGYFRASIEKGTLQVIEKVYVIKGLQTPLAGRPIIQKLNLLQEIASVDKSQEYLEQRFPQVFNGLGRIRGSYQIQLEDDAKPFAISTPRRVPIPLLPKVKEEF